VEKYKSKLDIKDITSVEIINETHVNNLNIIVTEQVNVIYNWVLGYAIS